MKRDSVFHGEMYFLIYLSGIDQQMEEFQRF